MDFHFSPRRFSACIIFCLCLTISTSITRADGSQKLYIVYLGEKKHEDAALVTASHHDMLSAILGSKEEALASITYSYKHGFSGFAAMLTDDQAQDLADLPEVISIIPNQHHELMTTRSWDFLGMNLNHKPPSKLLQRSKYGEDVIIGIVDTGIWPESRSFSDNGYGPIPSRWKGVCQLGQAWEGTNCNRKIIGARYYAAGVDKAYQEKNYMSARDINGHGTHTASIAAGAVVEGVSLHGLGVGVARGGAPQARLAVYKVGWDTTDPTITVQVASAAVLAAFDDAIHDGVDVLSLSLAVDENSFGALHAVQKGITVVYAAGNSGPRPQVIFNTAPWVITVAASKIDRSFPTAITLGNNQTLVGQSLYYMLKNESTSGFKPLVHGGSCSPEALNSTIINGKVVLCIAEKFGPAVDMISDAITNIKSGGASGLIFALYTIDVLLSTDDCKGMACIIVDNAIGFQATTYIGSQSLPIVKIEPARSITGKQVPGPKVAFFSSRGPSTKYPTVLKPDIAAPGVNILAAKGDAYVFNSGTSMSAPHVAGVVALLKAVHPHWSHAALKSAIVTTALTKDEYGNPMLAEALPRKVADPFDYGGGNINPDAAADPGLVYDIDPMDYNKFFACKIQKYGICNITTTLPAYHLNLPSISIPELRHPIKVRRAVTNVGKVDAVYQSDIQSPLGVKIKVEPPTLVFNAAKKVQTFKVSITPLWKVQGDYTFGSLTWHNEHHSVRIPIAVRITIQDFYAGVA
ncbi:subtilisin-like protease SBT3.5 [Lolium rigidum]|uniref:subtilisin-like protease SBT3.5 n=1 Tax=Lolium rigidum TaxID=89674 RepID=UPI001F5DAB25|nr:subtilisin-like protease SBT3.5 [Lolium rigidum]